MNKINKEELKARNVATIIFDFHKESSLFEDLNISERLKILADRVHILKTKFKDKPFAQLVAKWLNWLMEDYTEEHQLCPDCYNKDSYRVTFRQTYWQPEEGELHCESCGWRS